VQIKHDAAVVENFDRDIAFVKGFDQEFFFGANE
jgi:hypothetical protein